ncbi:alpha/beta fold hydrolase [Amycolatopsis sp. FDAARGOS 1241]|uniref:alpha/beta fold hydrolase n=1 Tax=Amycolatopsis sp. FDAARGOS 1241 TaxID=2778070 RepID=UPI001EF1AC80|nr:alpha/beta fold hydrolase [Amycolatopsis sp. FDAARGOS 1241]
MRVYLGIERWLVWGGSWGVTLALAYAQAHPERVTEMVLKAVTTGDRRDWLTRDMGRIFPREWERFHDGEPAAERDRDLSAAYSRLLHDPDPEVRAKAARRWCEWEDTYMSLAPDAAPFLSVADQSFQLAFARIVTHYWSHGCFLDEGQLLCDIKRLHRIPAVLIQGRYDVMGVADGHAVPDRDSHKELLDGACRQAVAGRKIRVETIEQAARPAVLEADIPPSPTVERGWIVVERLQVCLVDPQQRYDAGDNLMPGSRPSRQRVSFSTRRSEADLPMYTTASSGLGVCHT